MKQYWRLVVSLLACSCFIFDSVAAPMMGSPGMPQHKLADQASSASFLSSLSSLENLNLALPFDPDWQKDPAHLSLGIKLSEAELKEIFAPDSKILAALPFNFEDKIYDNFHFANQEVWIWEKVKKSAAPAEKVAVSDPPATAVRDVFSLNELNVDIPVVNPIVDQLRFSATDEGGLRIEYVFIDNKTKAEYPRATQIIPHLGIRDHLVISDGNFVLMLTDTGIKMLFRPYTDGYLFQAPIPVYTILAGMVKAENIEVSKIEFADAGAQPRVLYRNEDLAEVDRFKEGDLIITAKIDGVEQNILISREALVAQARIQSSILLTYMFLINPSMKDTSAFLSFAQQEKAMREIDEGASLVAQALLEEGLIENFPGEENRAAITRLGLDKLDPISEAQRTIDLLPGQDRQGIALYSRAAENKVGTYLSDLNRSKGPDAFDTLAGENRMTVTQQEWAELYKLTKDLPTILFSAKQKILAEVKDSNFLDRGATWVMDNWFESPGAKLFRDRYPKLESWRDSVKEIYKLLPDKDRSLGVKEILRSLPQDPYQLADVIINGYCKDFSCLMKIFGKGALRAMGYLAGVGVTAAFIEATGQQILDVSLLHKTMALISQMAYAGMNNDIVAAIIGPIVSSGEYFHKLWVERSGVEALMWVSGTGAALSTAFLALAFGARNFFTWGNKLYIMFNSMHKYLFNFLGIKNLRPAILQGIDPWKNKELFRRVPTQQARQENINLVANNLAIDSQARGEALAAVLAQSLGLNKQQTEQFLAEADGQRLALLGQAVQTLAPGQLAQNATTAAKVAEQYTAKARTANQVAVAGLKTAEDAAELSQKYSAQVKLLSDELKNILQRVLQEEGVKPGTSLTAKGVAKLNHAAQAVWDKLFGILLEIRDGLVLGRQAALSNKDFEGVFLDNDTIKIAKYGFLVDYLYSVLSAGGALPKRYANFLLFFCNSDGAMALQDTVEQLVLYGGLGAIGPFYSKTQPIGFESAWKPLINELNVREQKKISTWQATWSFVKSWFDPKVKNGVMHTHLNAELIASFYGFEARLWFGGIPRFLAFFLIFKEAQGLDWATALSSPELIGSSFLIAMFIQGFFNLSKFSYNFGPFYPGLGMPWLSFGYCLPWAAVLKAQRFVGGLLKSNKKLIHNVDHLLQEAVTVPVRGTYAKALAAVKEILQKGDAKIKLPPEFDVDITEYTPEKIQRLQQWFGKAGDQILATAENKFLIMLLNLTGSVGSVVLYAFVTLKLMTSDMTVATSARYFGGSIISIFATYLIYDYIVNYFNRMDRWPNPFKALWNKVTKKTVAQKIPAASKARSAEFRKAYTKDKQSVSVFCARFLTP
ncbi:MAG: hypothetical protein J6Y94_04445 [Bacteriovoracaceae bacterium]|nr:hypothetical protein [Bacteriovoracaceae bacterium]